MSLKQRKKAYEVLVLHHFEMLNDQGVLMEVQTKILVQDKIVLAANDNDAPLYGEPPCAGRIHRAARPAGNPLKGFLDSTPGDDPGETKGSVSMRLNCLGGAKEFEAYKKAMQQNLQHAMHMATLGHNSDEMVNFGLMSSRELSRYIEQRKGMI